MTDTTGPTSRATTSLGRVTGALATAGLAETAVREVGRRFLFTAYAAMRNLRIYPVDNPTVQKSLDELTQLTAHLVTREGEAEFRVAGEFLFLNATRMKLELDNYESFSFVLARCRESDIERLGFRQPPSARDWAVLITGLLDPEGAAPRERFEALRQRLEAHEVTVFRLRAFDAMTEVLDDDAELRARAKRAYEQAVSAMVDVQWAVRHGHPANLKRLKRVVQGIVDQVLSGEAPILALTTVRGYHEDAAVHAVEVCILSVALGRRVGLPRLALYQLGFAGIFHDVGLTRLPANIVDDEGLPVAERWRLVRQHPWLGVLALLQLKEEVDFAYRSMLVAYEHHMRRDLTGFPRSHRLGELTFYAKLVAVVDAYTALTSRRRASGPPLDPSAARLLLLANPRRAHDPVLLKVFGALLGTYPVGTGVVLTSGAVGVVVRQSGLAEMGDRPIVRLFREPDGTRQFPGRELDLAEVDEAGAFRHGVRATFDADRHGVRVGDFML